MDENDDALSVAETILCFLSKSARINEVLRPLACVPSVNARTRSWRKRGLGDDGTLDMIPSRMHQRSKESKCW